MADLFDIRLPASFWRKVIPEPNSGCWLWLGYADPQGYGRVSIGGKTAQRAHRVARAVLVGPAPRGTELDHRCKTVSCVNPDHLEPVTHRENVLRGEAAAATNARKTTCKRGHDLALAREYVRPDGRVWRACWACRLDYRRRTKRS